LTALLHTLANGFRIVTEDMPGLQSASIGLWVEAGGRHETAAQNGIAHFLEHMAFKGTRRRSALRIAEEIEDVGGYINAYTSREMTAYYARVLSQDVVMALDVIADIVLNPVFRKADIETERHVILQEIGQSLDTPDDIIFDWLHEVSYPDQPFGRTILGPEERVSAFRKADFEGFTGAHYGPDQMILSASGGVDHAANDARSRTWNRPTSPCRSRHRATETTRSIPLRFTRPLWGAACRAASSRRSARIAGFAIPSMPRPRPMRTPGR
jgi:predicted Zn-dependent peptidase